MLATFENIWGEATMDKIMKTYYNRWKFKHPGTQDFLDIVNDLLADEIEPLKREEIDKYTAMSFITFMRNWDENTNFYGKTWLGKHNNGVVVNMSVLMLDLPLTRVNTLYNWREVPILSRDKNGKIMLNKVIYQKKGFRFHG